MRLKGIASISKMSFLEATIFRSYFIISIFSNIVYMIIIYFLWGAIFDGVDGGVINGMTFNETFIYLALAGTVSKIIVSFIEWNMSSDMKSGDVAIWFTKPVGYAKKIFARSFGDITTNFLILFLPSFIIVYFLSNGYIKLGVNLLFFIVAFFLAAFISMLIDFLVGVLSFFTESVWGISIMKDTLVLLLAGAVIPLPFFPEPIRRVLEFLPFQAIYNLPLQILTNNTYGIFDFMKIILIQVFWVAIMFLIAKLCYSRASRHIIVNGG